VNHAGALKSPNLVEPVALLYVQGVDAFGSIDLADPLEVC
jgi:hypothetical protein